MVSSSHDLQSHIPQLKLFTGYYGILKMERVEGYDKIGYSAPGYVQKFPIVCRVSSVSGQWAYLGWA